MFDNILPSDHLQQVSATLPAFASVITLLIALLLDKTLGEARRFHYLVGFGNLANSLANRLTNKLATNPNPELETAAVKKSALKTKLLGAMAWGLLVLPLPVLYYFFIEHLTWYWQIMLDATVLYLAIGLSLIHI